MVKNESKHLEAVLKSIVPIQEKIRSEIIVLDTGSTDNSIEIAKQYTDKVYSHKWNNDFAAMRNKSISYAQGEWIFILDGDEVITHHDSLVNFLLSGKDKKFNCLFVKIKNILNDNQDKYNTAIIRRLFRNTSNFKYVGAIHEQPQFQNPAEYLDLTLVHYGYVSTDSELMEKKFKRNSELLHRVLEQEPDNIYYLHQLFNTYGMYKDYDNALYYSKKAYNIAKKKKVDITKSMYIYSDLATALYNKRKFTEVESICKEAISLKDGYVDFYYYLGKSQLILNKNKEAIESYEKYLELLYSNSNKDSTITNYTITFRESVYCDLCLLYMDEKNYLKVIEYALKIEGNNKITKVFHAIINSYIELEDFSGLFRFTKEQLTKFNSENNIIFYQLLEDKLLEIKIEEAKNKIIKLFSNGESDYSTLNKVRMKIHDDNYDSLLITSIEKLDFTTLPSYYGDLLYYLLKHNYQTQNLLGELKESAINNFLSYLTKKYNDLSRILYSYFQVNNFSENYAKARINKPLLRYSLILDNLKDKEFQELFSRYILEGTYYIKNYYHESIISNEKIYDVKSDEDGFLLYLLKALENRKIDEVEYLRYLRKALETYPVMKKGIENLLSEYTQMKADTQLQEVKYELKQQIENLISQNLFNDALTIVNESINIIKNDADLHSIKAVILASLRKNDEAIETLQTGLEYDPLHEDSLYNLAYLLESNNQLIEPLQIYTQLFKLTKDNEIKQELKDKILTFQQKLKQIEMTSRFERSKYAKKQTLIKKNKVVNSRMHVVYVLTHVGICGGVKIILEQANRLVDKGINVTLVCHYPKPSWYPVKANYLEVPFGEDLSRGIPNCDVIVATYWDHIQVCIDREIAPVIYFEQGDFHLFDNKKIDENLKKFIYQQYQLPNYIFTVSTQTAKVIKEIYHRKAEVIHNAIDKSIFNTVNNSEGNKCNPYILMMGSPDVKFKGLDNIIEAYNKVKESYPELRLYWITPTNPSIEYVNSVDKYFFNPSQTKIAELYRNALVYVSASAYESFSLPVLEAMSCGCPVVTTGNVGVLEYAKDKYNALIVKVNNSQDISRKVFEILRNKSLTEQLRVNGLKTAEEFDWSNIVDKILHLFKEVASYGVNKTI